MRRFFARLANLFRRRHAEGELAREIESHLACSRTISSAADSHPKRPCSRLGAPTVASSKLRNCIARRAPSYGSSNCSRTFATAGAICCAVPALHWLR